MAPVPDGASELPRSKPKTASPKRFAWRLYPFTTTSPTWATITVLNAPATVPSKPPRTPLINSPASFIISLKLGSLMMKLFLQSLKLVTKNTVCTSYKLSLGKWVTHSCRPMRDPQFLERGGCAIQKISPSNPSSRRRGGQTGENVVRRSSIEASPYRARASRHPVCAYGAASPPLRGGECRQSLHHFSKLLLSTFNVSRLRNIAITRASPTAASAEATTSTKKTNIWPLIWRC